MSQPLFGITTGSSRAVDVVNNFKLNFCDLHFGGKEKELLTAMDACDKAGIKYAPNFEGAPIGWVPSDSLKQDLVNRPGFLGFVLDEADHMQINAHWPVIDYYGYNDQHYLVETDGMDLFTAREAVLRSLRKRNQACMIPGKPAAVEHLFPVMMHTAARAGLNVSPKILKETCGPIMLAVAMGAAQQYGVDLWIDVDYWWHNETIGHSAERVMSALLLAYWSGASLIYVEGGAGYSNNHPEGQRILEAYKEFIEEYVPDHPRPYSWHDFIPEIAIIRFDDTCFDIRQRYLGEYPGPLMGHIPASYDNTEWLNIWSLLSHGFVRTDSASHQWEARRFNSRSLFIPLQNVVVYDHTVEYKMLKGLKLAFLSGVTISSSTYNAIERAVKEGLTCVLPPRLGPPKSGFEKITENTLISDGNGKWLVVPEYYRLHYECFCAGPMTPLLRDTLKPLIGDGDHLDYNFGKWIARFGQEGGNYPRHEIMTWSVPLTQYGTNPDLLEVEISETI